MAKRKSFDASPGKGGIGHNIKKAKKPKNILKSVKSFGIRKITDFLKENSQTPKALKTEEIKSEHLVVVRKTLGEVGNVIPNNNPIVNITKIKSEELLDMEIKEEKMEVKQEKVKETKVEQEIDDEPEYDPEMEGLCEYEKIRLRNIRERQAMFAKLEIDEAKSNCSPASAKRNKPQKRVFRLKENIEPRKSRRIAGGVPEIARYSASFDDYPQDTELVSRPRRSLPENYNDYLHATRTYTGSERPDGLVPVTEGRFKILQVPKKCTIKQFVLSNSLEFKCGRGFYEFTKPEIISYRKEVVLIEKSSGKMFTGRDACKMISAGSGIRIPPTAFETWRVFVQSTSYGRNLMGGTGFLYEV